MIMKKNIFIIALLALTFVSCNDWLEVTPPDDVEESELFSTGEGYRNALNGVYKKLSSESLYAQELTWGFLDVLAQYYLSYRLDMSHPYGRYVCNYQYGNSDVRGILDRIWQNSYNNIANCNNLLNNIENEDTKLFAGGKLEKNMIKGEALALRAFIHFDLLRLFAPALVKDDGEKYIPYCDIYPAILKERESVVTCLEKIKNDLIEAKDLVGGFDTIPEHKDWLFTRVRIEGNGGSLVVMPDDLFYGYRGFRMNYYAVKAILARVYSYSGELENAYNEAKDVCEAKSSFGNVLFDFTQVIESPKLYDGVIFGLSNKKIVDNFKRFAEGGKNQFLCVSDDMFYGQKHDVRYQFLSKIGTSPWAPLISQKYLETEDDGMKKEINESLIPIIRRSELYYIMGEYLYSSGKTQEAIDILKAVRIARNVPEDLVYPVNNEMDYREALLRDARREFIGEGQLFYMHKKFDIETSWAMSDKSAFVLPIPDSENINF